MGFPIKKAQIAPFLVLIIVILILSIAATVLIGELGFQRTRISNIADSALISGASSLCLTCNQIRLIHNQLFLNYISLQAMALAHLAYGPWSSKIHLWLASLHYLYQAEEMFDQAEELAEVGTKNLRVSLYDSCFGGALIDEPKPFLETEVIREPTGKIRLDYESYLKRDSQFTLAYRNFKKNNSKWYESNLLSYSFNKTRDKVLNHPGYLNIGEPDPKYESFLKVRFHDIPKKISVRPQGMFVFSVCWYGPFIAPCFVYLPWAWIRRINVDRRSFGMEITKRIPLSKFPFFGRDIDLSHTSRARIRGSVWEGFEFSLER